MSLLLTAKRSEQQNSLETFDNDNSRITTATRPIDQGAYLGHLKEMVLKQFVFRKCVVRSISHRNQAPIGNVPKWRKTKFIELKQRKYATKTLENKTAAFKENR